MVLMCTTLAPVKMNNIVSRDDALPLPGWNLPPRPHPKSSRRIWQRFSELSHVTHVANGITRALNQLVAHDEAASCIIHPFPHRSRENQTRQHFSFKVSAAQQKAAQEILRLSWNWVRRAHCDDLAGEDDTVSAASVLSALNSPIRSQYDNDTLHNFNSDFPYVNNDSQQRTPIVAQRLALPSTTRSVEMLSV
jgi:hypothetical protein